MIGLQGDIERALSSLGFRGENRKFVPHLTLGRAARGPQGERVLAERLAKLADYDGGAMGVDAVTVYASELSPQGPAYHVLARAPLS